MTFFEAGDLSFETVYAQPPSGGEDPAILDRLTRMIDDTPVGATIEATIFRLTIEPVRDALVAASNRGTVVRVVQNGRDVTDPVGASLSREKPVGLGAGHRWSGVPFDPRNRLVDYGAIATGPNADLHTKLFLFSATKDPNGVLRENVSWWGSANLSHRSGIQKSNNAVAVYGDAVLYRNFQSELWDLMWEGRHFPRNDFYNARLGRGTFLGSPAGKTKVFCSPEQDSDLWVNRLASVVVTPDTEVAVAQVRFTDSRTAVADELVRITEQGGSVRVLVGAVAGFLGPTVRDTLLGAGIALRTGDIHDKLVLVRSRYGASTAPRKVVFSGSHNLNYDANYVNDEILVKTFIDELYDDMLTGHFETIWAAGKPPVSPSATLGT